METNNINYQYELVQIVRDREGKKIFRVLRYSDGVIGDFSEKLLKSKLDSGMKVKNLKLGPYGHIEMGVYKSKKEIIKPYTSGVVHDSKKQNDAVYEVGNTSTQIEKLDKLLKMNSIMYSRIHAIYSNTLDLPSKLSGLGDSLTELEYNLDDIEECVDNIDDKIDCFGFGVKDSFDDINKKIDSLLSNPESLGCLANDIKYIKEVVSENYSLLQLQGEMSPKLDTLIDNFISPSVDSAEQYSTYTSIDKSKLGTGYYDDINFALQNDIIYGHMLNQYEQELADKVNEYEKGVLQKGVEWATKNKVVFPDNRDKQCIIEMLPYIFKDAMTPYVNLASALFNHYLGVLTREFNISSKDFEDNKKGEGFDNFYTYSVGLLGFAAAKLALPGAFMIPDTASITTAAEMTGAITEAAGSALSAVVALMSAGYGTLGAMHNISEHGAKTGNHNTKVRKVRKESKELLKDLIADSEEIQNYLDVDAFLLVLDYLYMFKYHLASKVYKNKTPNLCYMRMLNFHKINQSTGVFKDLQHHVLIAYLAAKLYIKANVRFNNDFSDIEIMTEAYKPSKNRNSEIFKRVKLQKHMEIPLIAMALHCMYINPDIIYKQVLSKYVEKLRDDDLSPLYIDSDTLIELLTNSHNYDAHILVNSLDHDKLVINK